jgi:V/A-type H+-transporting ATPase subunit E
MAQENAAADALRKEIVERSGADANAIIAQAEGDAARVKAEAKSEAEIFKAETLKKAAAQAEAVRKRILSGVHLEVKKRHLQVMEETLSRIFDQVRDRLEAFRKDKSYGAFLEKLAVEGIEALDSAEIQLVPGAAERLLLTRDRLAAVEKEAEKRKRKVALVLSDQTLTDGGVVLVSGDGRTRFDNTFSARIRRYQGELRMTAMKIIG